MLTNSQQQKNIFNISHKAIFISWLSSMLIQISKGRRGIAEQSARDHLQISLLSLSKFNRIHYLLFPLKSSENRRFSDDFTGNRS